MCEDHKILHSTDLTVLLAYKNTNFATFGFVTQTLYGPHTQSVFKAEFADPVVVEEVDEYVAVEHVVMDMEVIIKDSPMIFLFFTLSMSIGIYSAIL